MSLTSAANSLESVDPASLPTSANEELAGPPRPNTLAVRTRYWLRGPSIPPSASRPLICCVAFR